MPQVAAESLIVKTLTDNEFLIEGFVNEEDYLHFTLYDALGKLIIDYGNLDSKQINLTVNLKEFKAGIYFLNVYGVKTQKAIKLPVK